MAVFAFKRLQTFTTPGSMGVVNDARFVRCFWPRFNAPVAIFAPGSSGITVMGPPLPRNVVFPPDTVFEEAVYDAFYPAEQAVKQASPRRAGLVSLFDAETAVWIAAYDAAVAGVSAKAARGSISDDRFFLREKVAGDEYVASLTKQEADDLCDGKVTEQALRESKEFVSTTDGSILQRGI